MERLRKVLSIFAAATLLAPAGGALAGRPVFHQHQADHEGEEKDHATDRGAKPAKGTAGDLTLRSRALLGKDGKTQLEISTAPFDIGANATAPGNISEVHVRAVDPTVRDDDDDKDGDKDGKRLRFRRKYNHLRGGGYFTNPDAWTGLSHGQNLRVQAEARGAGRREEVEAKWIDVVRYRPDIVVTQINSPAQVRVKSTINVLAKLGEAMSELGAHTDCVLFIDDKQEDISKDVFIDANGTNTCIFTATFPLEGRHTLKVVAANVRPGDYDELNNVMSTSIEVLNPIIPVYTAQVTETTNVSVLTTDTYNSSASLQPDIHDVKTITTVGQERSFQGTIPNAVSLSQPLKFTYSDISAGQKLSSVTYDSITLDTNGNFLDDDTANSGRLLCIMRSEANNGSTNITFLWTTSETLTYSQKTCSTLALGCGAGPVTLGPAKPMNVTLANDYSAAVGLDDGTNYTASPTLTFSPFGSTTLVNVRNVCGPLSGSRGGKRCFLTDTAKYGKSGAVSVSPQVASQ